MAQGEILAEISISGDKTFTSALHDAGESIDDTATDAAALSGTLRVAGEALDETRGDAYGLARALSYLDSQADDAGDEVAQAGRRAAVTGGMFSALTLSTEGLAASMGVLGTTMTAALLPVLGTLAAAAVPVVAAFGGFLAIAGAIGGIGLGATLGAVATHGEQLKAALTDVVDAIKTTFEPVFDMAAGVLIHLSNTLEETISQMDPSQKMIQTLGTAFANLGDAVIELLPEFLNLATTLAVDFLPPFVDFAEKMLPKIPGLIRDLVGAFDRLLPKFMRAGRLLAGLAPELLAFGFTALNVVGPALGWLARSMTNALQMFNNLGAGVQELGIKMGLLAIPLAKVGGMAVSLASNFGLLGAAASALAGPLGIAIAGLGSLVAIDQIGIHNIIGQLQRLGGLADRAIGRLVTFLKGKGSKLIQGAFRAIGSAIRGVFVEAFNLFFKPDQSIVRDGIRSLAKYLKNDAAGDLKTAAEVLFDVFTAAFRGMVNGLLGEQGAFNSFLNGIIGKINEMGRGVEDFAEKVPGLNFDFKPISAVGKDVTPRQLSRRRAAEQAGVDVRITTDDERFDAYVDGRYQQKEQQKGDDVRANTTYSP